MSTDPYTLLQLADLRRQDLLRDAAAERLVDLNRRQHSAVGAAPNWSLRIAIAGMAVWLRS